MLLLPTRFTILLIQTANDLLLIPDHISLITFTGLAVILSVAGYFGVHHECLSCFWLIVSGPLALVGISLGWYGSEIPPQDGSMLGMTVAGIVLTLFFISMILSHSYKKHMVTVMFVIVGVSMWLLTALGIASTAS